MSIAKFFISAVCLIGCVCPAFAQNQVTIQGKVKFTDKDFKVSVYQRIGREKKVLAETLVNDDNTYSVTVQFDKPGMAIVDCGRWQSVNIWLDDENMDIDFRGVDTAKVKIKNPPYVYIRAGKKNEVMNLVNFAEYRTYQSMIAVSQNVWKAQIEDKKSKQELSSSLYEANIDNRSAWMHYIVENYADVPSVLVPLALLDEEKDTELINKTLCHLEKLSSITKQLVADYRQNRAEEKMLRERNKLKGKIIVLDFWASWCGPCRREIPNIKKYYAEYKTKGVQFLSVSIDAKKDDWTKALKEEQMLWMQGWTPDSGKSVLKTYQFNGIPFIILIDKEGKIYRKYLRGEQIKKAIDDCLIGKRFDEK